MLYVQNLYAKERKPGEQAFIYPLVLAFDWSKHFWLKPLWFFLFLIIYIEINCLIYALVSFGEILPRKKLKLMN